MRCQTPEESCQMYARRRHQSGQFSTNSSRRTADDSCRRIRRLGLSTTSPEDRICRRSSATAGLAMCDRAVRADAPRLAIHTHGRKSRDWRKEHLCCGVSVELNRAQPPNPCPGSPWQCATARLPPATLGGALAPFRHRGLRRLRRLEVAPFLQKPNHPCGEQHHHVLDFSVVRCVNPPKARPLSSLVSHRPQGRACGSGR